MAALEQLNARITRCRRCPRLVRWREAVAAKPPRRHCEEKYWARPLPGFGDHRARVLIVGLAPAATARDARRWAFSDLRWLCRCECVADVARERDDPFAFVAVERLAPRVDRVVAAAGGL